MNKMELLIKSMSYWLKGRSQGLSLRCLMSLSWRRHWSTSMMSMRMMLMLSTRTLSTLKRIMRRRLIRSWTFWILCLKMKDLSSLMKLISCLKRVLVHVLLKNFSMKSLWMNCSLVDSQLIMGQVLFLMLILHQYPNKNKIVQIHMNSIIITSTTTIKSIMTQMPQLKSENTTQKRTSPTSMENFTTTKPSQSKSRNNTTPTNTQPTQLTQSTRLKRS